MGRHKKWRAQVKKLRRKRIRRELAIKRDEEQARREASPTYQIILREQSALELIRQEEEECISIERNKKWLEDEEIAQKNWRELQEKIKRAQKERAEQEIRIRNEWQLLEQEKLKKKEEKKRADEEERKKQEELLLQIDNYISTGGPIPAPLLGSTGQRPNCEECPFYAKTGACRFGERCSRNHVIPGLSPTILVPGFYSHFGLDQSLAAEFDPDLMLEYEERDREQHFRLFYNDIVPELQKFGKILTLRVCCNAEPHLRGNVYIEYENERQALKAFRSLTGRWYASKQLQPRFIQFRGWKEALCGLHFRRECPKGATCNFLHVFRNPGNAFDFRERERARAREEEERDREHERNWRWDSDDSDESSYMKRTKREHHRHHRHYRSRSSHRRHQNENTKPPSSRRRHHKRHFSSNSSSSESERRHSRRKRNRVLSADENKHSKYDHLNHAKVKNKNKTTESR